ncbi:MAG: biotin--[acetyl-CoA-carboxylase] ligase [Lutibacter sp.]|uniref:biotin--[acetyl-CoA-carboxylase] ligase n=1 Tax=Lutibacter sp. TaxID=1925666 RepID=UPI0019FA9F1D|nr:biotin--[acetyl-CoA-carboxylase] ligase [Lutibacter sp.]NOR28239.1 biotin--[acetyl-CoA-carboxylase] ligase [Lutibacter sp.]
MIIIKLNAIDSTNSYLKKQAENTALECYTVVVAEDQFRGRGQVGASWVSDKGKNLTFSTLINFENFKIEDQFYLSMVISLSVLQVLNKRINIQLTVKWPNDILAEKDKVAGILIENVLSGKLIKQSVIGIGLNVNQKEFPKNIRRVTSLKNISGISFDKDELMRDIVNTIKKNISYIKDAKFGELKRLYIATLYKFNKPTMFEDVNGTIFLGKIVDVFKDGRLVIELKDETTHKFSLKKIKFASRK